MQKKSTKLKFPQELEFGSAEYYEFLEYIGGKKGPGGLSLCINHWKVYNPYWKDKHIKEFPKCLVILPKEWVTEDEFLRLVKQHTKIKGENCIIRPIFYDEEDEDMSQLPLKVNQ